MSKPIVLQVKVISNIDKLSALIEKACMQASTLTATIEEMNNFQLEINAELVKSEKKVAALEPQLTEQPNDINIKCAYLGCNNNGENLDNIEVAPGVWKKRMVCRKHIGQLKDSNFKAIGR